MPLLFAKQRLQLPMRGQIIDRELQIFVRHRSVTNTDLGCEEIYRRNDLTGEGSGYFYKGCSRNLSASNEQTSFQARIADKAKTKTEHARFPYDKLKKEQVKELNTQVKR